MKPFVIAGCGRSGTMGMAQFLMQAKISVSFEDFFQPTRDPWDVARFPDWCKANNVSGEVSSLAAPFVRDIPDTVTVLHQVRNPIAVIASLQGLGNLHPRSHWLPNIRFNFRHLPEMSPSDDPLILAMKYWIGWNELIEQRAEWRYRIEDAKWDDANHTLGAFGELLSRISRDTTDSVIYAAGHYSTAYNHGTRDTSVSWWSLPNGRTKTQMLEKALEYGYTHEDVATYCPLGTGCPHHCTA